MKQQKTLNLDDIDRRLLSALKADARISNVDLAERISLSPTPCLRRVKKLEQRGVIKGYEAILDPAALGLEVSVFAFVKLSRKSSENAAEFEREIGDLDAVTECSVIAGSYDYLLRIVARSLQDYERLLKERLANIETIADIESMVVLKQVACSNRLPS